MYDNDELDSLEGIAIIGMSGRFPGAKNVDQFWHNLANGVETISRFSEGELEFSVSTPEDLAQGQTYIRARAVLEDVDQFDAAFFDIYPREAEIMDPQHRFFLECAWETLETGGYDPERYSGLIGVYSSLSMNTYLLYNLCENRNFAANFAGNYQVGFYQEMLGNDKDFLPTRVSYKLNLKGPSMSIQTACSSSLVAICQACTGLLNYQCDMALAGGVSISFPQKRDYLYQEDAMLSADGTCRVFDAGAHGTVFGHGVAVLLLKRLSDAIEDGDTVLGVIKGSAINNDGSVKIGYAAPSITAQAEVIAMAQASAGIDPESISYIEAHGTGTPLGDPIEVAALTKAFRDNGSKSNGYCALGSCKTHIGHLDVASGATGLIKTILQLQHETIPPLLYFKSPNPKIDFENSPFFPVTKAMPWKRGKSPRRAGISAFGVGGTNAHVILEEAPSGNHGSMSRGQQLLILSAKTSTALNTMTVNLADHLERRPELNLADAAYTLQNGRKQFSHRRSVVASNAEEAVARLRSLDPKYTYTRQKLNQAPSVVFMFPGQGSQHVNMGRELHSGERVFRETVDICSDILQSHLNLDIRKSLFPDVVDSPRSETQINDTWLAQPAIFVIEYAMAKWLISIGINPTVMIGHSIGEYVAAVLAEAFTLEDALRLLSERARMMQNLPSGAMLSVRMNSQELVQRLPDGISIAAINSPSLCVVSGSLEAIKSFEAELSSQNVACRRLHTSHAFHSAMMEPMLEEFAVAARQTAVQTPKMRWISTCTGTWMNMEDLDGGVYWVNQIRQTVRFSDAVRLVIEEPNNCLIEVGPGQSLSQLAKQNATKPADTMVVPTLGPAGETDKDLASLLVAVGKLWTAGVDINWPAFSAHEQRMRIPLPVYPFERKRFWAEPAKTSFDQTASIPTKEAPTMQNTATYEQNNTEPAPSNTNAMNAGVNQPDTPDRKERIIDELRKLFAQYSGADHSLTDPNETFMDLGFDSLLVTQASLGVKKSFGVKVTFRQMLEDYSTFESLATFLDSKMPADALAAPAPRLPQPSVSDNNSPTKVVAINKADHADTRPSPTSNSGLLESVIQQQMAIMAEQLNLIRQASTGENKSTTMPFASEPAQADNLPRQPVITAVNLQSQTHFGPFKAIEKGSMGGLTEKQQAALSALATRYNQRTAKSKAIAQQHRRHFCDPRAAGNFRQLWKEMVYPIACAKSLGSHIWDIDGNEYIDVTMGFGTNYMGHSPEFVMKALRRQMDLGVEIGPQSPLAGEVAKMICEFSGLDRATFCNTGSEAVMASFRVARAVTGREKVVYFYGDYHGIFDEVLGRPALCDGIPGAMPIATGIPHLANVMILEYGNPSSIETIRQYADDIAAVIVEPVQSRHPEIQPREFLHELRKLTNEYEIALVFDEIITGFRVAPGGAQEHFGVKADMATYGKVVGGGMPIGVLAGSATYMDALDGGHWQYGDDSSPPTGVTFFAGTFVRHPLAMAAAHAVLTYLKSVGPELQTRTNQRTKRFVEKVNAFFDQSKLPMKFHSFSAMFYYDFHPDLKYAGLLFYYLRDRGIHIWEGRVGHLSIAHTDEELDQVFLAIQQSVEEMQSAGFLPASGEYIPQVNRDDPFLDKAKSFDLSAVRSEEKNRNRFPLCQAQLEMWAGAQMRPEAAGPHHACTGLYLDGDLDINLFQRALGIVIQRHEGLRCTFSEDGTEVIMHQKSLSDIVVHDLSGISEKEREARVNEALHREGRRLLDLTEGPLVDFQLLKLSDRRHLLIFTAQMIICDGWSHYVVFEDLSEIYNALCRGSEPDLEDAVPMRQYAHWELENANSIETQECEKFWESQFGSSPEPVDLPTSRPRPPVRTYDGRRCNVILPQDLYRDIKQLAKDQKNSYFAVLLASFQVWLHRLSGAEEIVTGVPFAAQSQLGMDRLVGQCANTLPIRTRIVGADGFDIVLKAVWESVLDAQENWNFSYGRLIPKLDLPRDSSRIPLVAALFNIDPPMTKVGFENLEHRFVTGPRYYFQYDIGFNLVEGDDSLIVECDYNPKLFEEPIIENWLEGYQSILKTVIADPRFPVGRIPMTKDGGSWPNQTTDAGSQTANHTGWTIEGTFADQANRSPNELAVSTKNAKLTYGELDHLSDRLGSYLTSIGVSSGTVVGVWDVPSIDLPIALLSILKAGGAYVLIESSWPTDTVNQLISDSGVTYILHNHKTDLGGTLAQMVDIKAALKASKKDVGLEVHRSDDSNRSACIIYHPRRSGSARKIEIKHRSIVNILLSMKRKLDIVPGDVVLWHSPSIAGFEFINLWLPLLAGAKIVCDDRTIPSDPLDLSRAVDEQKITCTMATPSAWQILLNSGLKANPKLKALCWGEPLSKETKNLLLEKCGSVWNLYGSAETAMVIAVDRVVSESPITLGFPVDNAHLLVVDEMHQPLPAGIPGEILASGLSVFQLPEESSAFDIEKYVDIAFDGKTKVRCLKTGDLGRYRNDGKIEFFGRINQSCSNINGKYQLSEIRSILSAHSSVIDSVVVVRCNPDSAAVLAAYIVPTKTVGESVAFGTPKLVRELHRLLRRQLPEHMIPKAFVVIESIPRKSDGRVDDDLLPEPEENDFNFEEYVPPSNQTEQMLTDIWQKFLKIEKVSVKDNFFDLGGQSLLAVRIFAQIEKQFGKRFPVTMLFRAPTIELLARKITDENSSDSTWPSLIPIQPKGKKKPFFLVHGAGGNILLYRPLAKRLEPDYPLYGLQSQGLDGKSQPLKTITEMAHRYLEEIRSVQPSGPYLLGGYCLGGTIAYEMAQNLTAGGEKVELLAMLDTYNFIRALKVNFFTFLIQKIKFHWGNFIKLNPWTMWKYLREKKRIAGDGGWAHIRTERPGTTLQDGVARAESGIEASVQDLNDHAADVYDPQPYPGVLTLFKPHINYKFYPDPNLGWKDLALGGLDIVEMPINPHAMLVEPYVKILSEELKIRLDRVC